MNFEYDNIENELFQVNKNLEVYSIVDKIMKDNINDFFWKYFLQFFMKIIKEENLWNHGEISKTIFIDNETIISVIGKFYYNLGYPGRNSCLTFTSNNTFIEYSFYFNTLDYFKTIDYETSVKLEIFSLNNNFISKQEKRELFLKFINYLRNQL